MPENGMIIPVRDHYESYLHDESGLSGFAESISFPKETQEIVDIVRAMGKTKTPVTIQGGKTGLCGGAVPFGGHLMNMSQMDRFLDFSEENGNLMTVEAGMTLEQLENIAACAVKGKPLFWPCAPSELTATVGGAAATDAKGIFRYGSCRDWIETAEIVTSDGRIRRVSRRDNPEELSAAIGGEGVPGVFTALTLRLMPKPDEMWGICFFFENDETLCAFIEDIRKLPAERDAVIGAAEYLDGGCIRLIRERKASSVRLRGIPDADEQYGAALYVELHGTEDKVSEMAGRLMENFEARGCAQKATWAAWGETEIARLRLMCHAAAESINILTDSARMSCPQITKLSSDICSGRMTLRETLAMYRKGAADRGIGLYIFGHALEGGLSANLAPKTGEEYEAGAALLREWAVKALEAGGSCVCQYGIGKLKRRIYGGLLKTDGVSSVKNEGGQ